MKQKSNTFYNMNDLWKYSTKEALQQIDPYWLILFIWDDWRGNYLESESKIVVSRAGGGEEGSDRK